MAARSSAPPTPLAAVARHVDLQPDPSEAPPQQRFDDADRLHPTPRDGLMTGVEQAVLEPDALR